jgi:hypothetical protein
MDGLVILILVARGETADATTLGAVRAARELLGDELRVQVREIEAPMTDERALEIGKTAGASAIIELVWDSPEHRQARVHFHVEPRRGWNDRVIGFDPDDDPSERGRTVGFAVASMLPGRSSGSSQSAVEPRRSDRDMSPENPESSTSLQPGLPSLGRRWLGSVDAVGSTSVGIGGEAPGWGGSLSARWYFRYPIGLRIGGSARAGAIDPAQATSLHLHAAAGLVWLALPATVDRPFEVGARIDVLAIRERLTHYDSDDPEPADLARWIPGADAAIEGAWLFNPTAGLVGSVATEVAFGSTDVTLHYNRVATIPPVRLVFQAGVRASF